jgi:hypothetical protein
MTRKQAHNPLLKLNLDIARLSRYEAPRQYASQFFKHRRHGLYG